VADDAVHEVVASACLPPRATNPPQSPPPASGAGREQPPPVPNQHPPVVPQVIADLEQRMALGIRRYGVPLQPGNGRDMLLDAYQEALDLAVYLKGALLERETP
jgi:hypothetical protein